MNDARKSCRPGATMLAFVALAIAPVGVIGADKAKPAAAPNNAASKADAMRLETTEIKGHEGLPRVLYIVPWKRAEAGDLRGRPAQSLLDDVIAPVDRAEFRRQLNYESALASANAKTADKP